MPDNDDSEGKYLRFACIGDEFLRAEVRKEGESAACSYCGKKRKSVAIAELADRIEGVLLSANLDRAVRFRIHDDQGQG